jgi:hypothetical protein
VRADDLLEMIAWAEDRRLSLEPIGLDLGHSGSSRRHRRQCGTGPPAMNPNSGLTRSGPGLAVAELGH